MSYVKKPYCKVCHDSGKSEKEYTNHWVKDLNGKITCPTLLATECRYCYKLGHTTKFCPALKTKPSITKPKKQQPVKVRDAEKLKTKNAFASLYCSDNEEDQDQDQHEDHEDHEDHEGQYQIPIKTGWASIVAAKAPEIKLPEGPNMVVLNRYTKYIPTPEQQPKPELQPKPEPEPEQTRPKRSWADLSDSEDEDEYEY